ncbi:AraC family transcriptional regulator [Parafrankia sp. FMc2]
MRQHREWSGVSVDEVTWRASPGSTGEIHKPLHQIFVSLHGSAGKVSARAADGSRYSGHDFPGAVTFVPAGCHRVARYGGGTLTYLGITIPAGRHPESETGAAGRLRPFMHEVDPLLSQVARTLANAPAHPSSSLLADSASVLLLTHLMQRDLSGAGRSRESPAVLAPSSLRQVVDYIEANLGAELRLAELARVAGMQVHHLARAFKQALGLAPYQFVTQRRLARAAELLRDPAGPSIADVALRVGLSSQSHLTTSFRRVYGLTPAAYRAQHR